MNFTASDFTTGPYIWCVTSGKRHDYIKKGGYLVVSTFAKVDNVGSRARWIVLTKVAWRGNDDFQIMFMALKQVKNLSRKVDGIRHELNCDSTKYSGRSSYQRPARAETSLNKLHSISVHAWRMQIHFPICLTILFMSAVMASTA